MADSVREGEQPADRRHGRSLRTARAPRSAVVSARSGRATVTACARCAEKKADVLCQPPSAVADAGLPSSASRSALRAASSVTAAPAIRSVAARSGRGPDGVGMVTAMCCCRPRWRAGSYGVRSCQQRHTIRHHARPTVRSARGCSWPRARALVYRSCAQGCQWRVLSASVQNAPRRRLLHPHRNLAVLRLPDSTATAAWPASAASASRVG
jgi:hypothetical protein